MLFGIPVSHNEKLEFLRMSFQCRQKGILRILREGRCRLHDSLRQMVVVVVVGL